MANIVKKNVEKGVNSTLVVAIASLLSILIQGGLGKLGVDVDASQVTIALTVALSGAIAGLHNWYTHRKKRA